MKTAVEEYQTQKEELKAFTQGREVDSKIWLKGISEWEEDQERPLKERAGIDNPYQMPKSGT